MSKEPISDAGAMVIQSGDAELAAVPLALESNRRRTKTKFIPKMRKVAGKIPFADDLAASYYCAIDAKTPLKAKAVLYAALAYFVLPADVVPDIVAGMGYTDDATVLATALSVVGAHIKPRHRRAARRLLKIPEPRTDADQ